MCGIFGLALSSAYGEKNDLKDINRIANNLFSYSQTRGSEAAGIAINNSISINILRKAISPKKFIASDEYKKLLIESFQEFNSKKLTREKINFSLIGHSRLVTNGNQTENSNNQPVFANGIVGVHNGIITNEEELLNKNKDIKKESQLDSELLLKLINKKNIQDKNIFLSMDNIFREIEGSASVAFFHEDNRNLVLSTNTGSLFYCYSKEIFIFASERFILNKLLKNQSIIALKEPEISQIKAQETINFDLDKFSFFKSDNQFKVNEDLKNNKINKYKKLDIFDKTNSAESIKRCKKCVLPSTYPFMDFDEEGICRYCRRHKKFVVNGEKELFNNVEKYRSKNGNPDCIVALSGGRDSSYGLHYIKKILGMNPIAFTYDWGFVSDLARRNTARLCGALGVDHIIRTSNIEMKRKNVRLNVKAWLKRPEIGMIPLFMAGDKAFYYYARQIRKETGIKLVFFCTGNMMEDTPYKFGFSGIRGGESGNTLTGIKRLDKIRLLNYYLRNFLINPNYINSSLLDTGMAYWHTFMKKDDFLYLYKYIKWDEKIVVDTIVKEYGWELSSDTNTTWRIGDSTAAFYNYIYYSIAGFSEDDDMLSHMVREGTLSRDEALKRSIDYAKPRTDSIMDYLQTIGLNYTETLTKINKIKKMF